MVEIMELHGRLRSLHCYYILWITFVFCLGKAVKKGKGGKTKVVDKCKISNNYI